jgi:hypothetical protein
MWARVTSVVAERQNQSQPLAGLSSAHANVLPSVRRLLVTANVVPSSQIFVTLLMEALSTSETSVFTRATFQKTAFFIVTAVKTSNLT